MNYIYRYTNKINGKTYVGQTNNLNRRKIEHRSAMVNNNNPVYDYPFYRALRKYGFDSFEYSVLEEIEENENSYIDERERFWISYCNSYENGYNQSIGGQDKSHTSKFSEEDIEEIKKMILSGSDYNTIGSKFKISKTFISNINYGFFFFEKDVSYPLYNHRLSDEVVSLILYHLKECKLSFREISVKLGVSQATVKKINYGTLRKGLSDTYPIRTITPQEIKINLVIHSLLNSTLSNREISKLSEVSIETVRRTNLGICNKKENLVYPLRKYVETIPG